MDSGSFLATVGFLGSPVFFGILVMLAGLCLWLALAPARPAPAVQQRLDGYVERDDAVDDEEMQRSFGGRVIAPALRRLLRALGRLEPQRSLAEVQGTLMRAGAPGGLTALDFVGLRLLAAAVLGGGYLLFA